MVNILREAGLDPGPKRGEDAWDDFIKRHAATLWSCDFFSKHVWTLRGLVEVHVLFFLNLETRRVHVAGMTAHPDRALVAQQARNTALFFAEQEVKPAVLLRDNDQKYGPEFDAVFAAEGVAVKRITPASPNLNARAERWVQTVKRDGTSAAYLHGRCRGGYNSPNGRLLVGLAAIGPLVSGAA